MLYFNMYGILADISEFFCWFFLLILIFKTTVYLRRFGTIAIFQTFLAGLAGSWDIIRLLEISSCKIKCWWFKKIIQEQMEQIYFQSHELKYEWLT